MRPAPFAGYVLVVIHALIAASPAIADERDQDRALQALREGRVRPLAEILATVARQVPGEVINVEIEQEDSALFYEIKVLTGAGRIVEIKIEAMSGRILEIE